MACKCRNGINHFYFLHGIIWAWHVHCRTKDKGNWDQKSVRSQRCKYYNYAEQGFCFAYTFINCNCIADCMVFHETMAAGLCIPHKYQLVGIFGRRAFCNIYRFNNSKFSCDQSSDGKSGEEPANGMMLVNVGL